MPFLCYFQQEMAGPREGGGKLAAKEGRESRYQGTMRTPGRAAIIIRAMRAG